MKAKQYDGIRTTVTVESDAHPGTVYPAGTQGAVVEAYERPHEGYAVGLVIDDDRGRPRYDHVVLTPEQSEVTEPYAKARRRPERGERGSFRSSTLEHR